MPASHGLGDAVQMGRLSVDQNLAGVGAVNAGENLHERRFAGAVLADHGQHFAALHVQRHAVERLHAGKMLADIADFQERSWERRG